MSDQPSTQAIPVDPERRALARSFAPFAFFNYRLFVIGAVATNTGSWMQRVAMDWLVLQLTHDVALVGVTVALQFAPVIVIGIWGGVLSDRVERRRVLVVTQSLMAVVNGTLAIFILFGDVVVWQVMLAALLAGILSAIDGPARFAFVGELVGDRHLQGAITVNAMTFHLGGLAGPAISSGLIVWAGTGWSIAGNVAASVIAVATILAMRGRELHPVTRSEASRGQVAEAVRYAVRKPAILWTLVMLFFISSFGMNLPVLLSASAASVWDTDAAGYGLYSTVAAVGAFLGAIVQARRASLTLRGIVFACGLFGVVTVATGLAPWHLAFVALLLALGAARMAFAIPAQSLTGLSANLAIRGRIASLYFIVVAAGQAVGGVLIGFITEHAGAQVGFLVAGGVPAAVALVVAIVLARRRGLTVRLELRRPRSLRIVRR